MTEFNPITYEKAIDIVLDREEALKRKVERQRGELAKMSKVYARDIEQTKVWEALKFLLNVLISKIKIHGNRVQNK
jgi:hypothetical protein